MNRDNTTGTGTDAAMLFRHLADSSEFAEFALIVKRLTGLSMALNTPTVDAIRIGVPRDPGNPLCRLIRGTSEGMRRCEECDRQHHARAAAAGEAALYACHAGFYDLAVPIVVEGRAVATISSGQVLPERPSPDGCERMLQGLRWLPVPARRLRAAYRKAPWLPREHLGHVTRLLELFARQLCESALRMRRLEARLEREEIRRAKELVAARFTKTGLQLGEAAACAGLSPAHFSHVFHRETGTTFTRYVQARRVEEGKRLLVESGKSITEICFACGFASLTHFNRVFRRLVGCSPRQYRTRERGR